MNLFGKVKTAVNVKEAAERYGIRIERGSRALCPFHDDHTPSMKLNDDYFYCFTCQATGDVVDLTAKLFGCGKYEAAQRLASDFGIDPNPSPQTPPKPIPYHKTQQFKDDERLCFVVLAEYLHLLRDRKTKYAPTSPEDIPDARFIEACQKEHYAEYLTDIFICGASDERADVVTYLMQSSRIHELQNYINQKKQEDEHDEQIRKKSA